MTREVSRGKIHPVIVAESLVISPDGKRGHVWCWKQRAIAQEV